MNLRSVYFADPMGRPRPNVRIFADVDDRRFEFVRLDPSTAIEVYDYPKAWRGVARFLGYLPADRAAQLVLIAQRAIDRRWGWDRHSYGRTFEWPAATGRNVRRKGRTP